MSRDIVDIYEKPGRRSGFSFLFGPIVFVGVDEVGAEDFAGGPVGDGGFVFVDEDEDLSSCVGSADAEVVEPTG